MPFLILSILDRSLSWLSCRILLTTVFWVSALHDVVGFPDAVAEMTSNGLHPAWLYAVAVAATLLVGSALVILDCALWVGVVMLIGFLLLTIPVAHPFWSMPAARRTLDLQVSLEHLSLCGGLFAALFAARFRRAD